jgi:pimeloyl-ACP methyl ester carboxylesterase
VAGDLLDAATIRVARIDLADSITGLAELVLAEAPAQFALAGHSLGAIVALAVARMAPERVTRLALLNASGRAPSDEQRANWSALADRVEAGEFLEVAYELALRNLPDFRRADGPLVSGSTRMAASIGSGGLLRQLAAQQSRGDLLPSLADVRVPTLVVSGERDDVSPVEWQRELARGIPGAHYRILPDTGHLSPCENPAGVASLLREWLGS